MRISSVDSGNSGVLFIGFNQDYGCFAVGMQNGFRVFNSDPLKQLERHEFDVRDGTGVGYLEMLYRTNLLGILGGGHHSRLPSNVACLWDGIKQQFMLEISCSSDVKAIRLRKDRIIIVLPEAVKVYTFGPTPELVYECGTCPNPLGLCHVCQTPENPLVAVPGKRIGSVLLANIGDAVFASTSTPCRPSTVASSMPPRQLIAHENALAALEMNASGSLLATCSLKGTIIRVFCTKECQLVQEFRRGLNPATITSLCFNQMSDLLCVTSDRGTAHIFSLKNASLNSRQRNLSLPATGTAASSDVSAQDVLANYVGNASQVRCVLETKYKAICAFSQLNPNVLIVLSADGSYYKYSFTRKGSVNRVTFVNFLDFYDDEADF